ncbi:MAG: hypothetical protein ACI4WX_00840 [Aristaeellaceae bacterium]
MRLIDADVLKQKITKFHAGLKPRYISKLVDAEIADIQDIIDETQTVDAEPVRHGRWDFSGRYRFKDGGRAVRCTACGCSLHLAEFLKYTWNFCPVCGAKMEVGAEK